MSEGFIGILLIQILIMLEIILVFLFIIKLNRTIKYEKRITKFSLGSTHLNDSSYFDRFTLLSGGLVVFFANMLRKNKIFSKKVAKYEKYGLYNNKTNEEYFVIKVGFAIGLGLIVFFVTFVQQMSYTYIYTILGLGLGYVIPSLFWNNEYELYTKEVTSNLLEAIIVVNAAIRDGSTVLQAMNAVSSQLGGSISIEFKKIEQDISYGLGIDQAFKRFHERIKHEDTKKLYEWILLYKEINGSYAIAFEQLEKSFYENRDYNNDIKAFYLFSNYMYKIFLTLPLLVIMFSFAFNDEYVIGMFFGIPGYFIIAIMIMIYVFYLFIVKKLLENSR